MSDKGGYAGDDQLGQFQFHDPRDARIAELEAQVAALTLRLAPLTRHYVYELATADKQPFYAGQGPAGGSDCRIATHFATALGKQDKRNTVSLLVSAARFKYNL